MTEIDCRGLACPEPVIRTKKAIETAAGAQLKVMTDTGASCENVIRFAKTTGYKASLEVNGSYCLITLSPPLANVQKEPVALENSRPNILITSNQFGTGSEELGRLLLKNFIITLLEINKQPATIFCINSGVLIAIDDSELIEPLQKLSGIGVEILSCGVCLDYYGVRDRLAIGSVTNMFTIADALLSVDNTIRI